MEDMNCIKRFIKKNNGSKLSNSLPRFGIMIFIFIIAFAAPKFSTVLNLFGAFAGTGM